MNHKCHCGADFDEPHVHLGGWLGFSLRDVLDLITHRQRVLRRNMAAILGKTRSDGPEGDQP